MSADKDLLVRLAALEAAYTASEAARAASESARAASEATLAEERAASESARAASEATLAEERAASEARIAALCAQLGSLGPPSLVAARSVGAATVRCVRASLTFPSEQLLSPTSEEAPCFLESSFAALIGAPVSLAVDAALAPAFSALLSTCRGARGVMKEGSCYARATAHLPAFAEAVGAPEGDASAATLFTMAAMRTSVWSFSSRCKPELHVRAHVGGGGEGQPPMFRPAFNGELKSAGDGRALEQAAYYAAMDMVRVFFPAAGDAPCARRFFSRPPLGFALVGFPHVAYYIALEWVGKLLVSLASAPFLIGSAAHAAAAAALPDTRFDAPQELVDATLPWRTPASGGTTDRTAWCVAGGVFRKLVRGDARSGERFASMHRAYVALAELLPRAPAHLHLVASATLRYGAHELVVELPEVVGREASDAEVTELGPVLSGAAAAVAWLAAQGVLYCDLRGPNVLVDAGGAPWLVDFDDCEVVAPVFSEKAFATALSSTWGAQQQGTFATRYCAGSLPIVRRAMRVAFGEIGGGGGGMGGGRL